MGPSLKRAKWPWSVFWMDEVRTWFLSIWDMHHYFSCLFCFVCLVGCFLVFVVVVVLEKLNLTKCKLNSLLEAPCYSFLWSRDSHKNLLFSTPSSFLIRSTSSPQMKVCIIWSLIVLFCIWEKINTIIFFDSLKSRLYLS